MFTVNDLMSILGKFSISSEILYFMLAIMFIMWLIAYVKNPQ